MKILTKEILRKLPECDATAHLQPEEIKVPLKLFAPLYGHYWYVYGYDRDTGEAIAFVNLGDYQMAESGYIDLDALIDRMGWKLERDKWFDPMTLSEIKAIVKSGGHV